jgi:hypothetical protein
MTLTIQLRQYLTTQIEAIILNPPKDAPEAFMLDVSRPIQLDFHAPFYNLLISSRMSVRPDRMMIEFCHRFNSSHLCYLLSADMLEYGGPELLPLHFLAMAILPILNGIPAWGDYDRDRAAIGAALQIAGLLKNLHLLGFWRSPHWDSIRRSPFSSPSVPPPVCIDCQYRNLDRSESANLIMCAVRPSGPETPTLCGDFKKGQPAIKNFLNPSIRPIR